MSKINRHKERALTLCRLKEVLLYDPKTGVFRWIKQLNSRSKVGSIAGCPAGGKFSYIRIRVDGYYYPAHRLAWFWVTGSWPINKIDHKRGLSNRFNNLREATAAQNNWNSKRPRTNTTGVKNVYWDERYKRWDVRIRVNGNRIRIGCFKVKKEAVLACRQATKKYHGEFARL